MEILYGIALSAHLGLAGDYNLLHPHVRLQDNQFITGIYVNSMDDISVYGGVKFDYDNFWVEGALVTGYNNSNISPYIRVGKEIYQDTSVFVAPALESFGETNIGVVIGIEFLSK